MGFDNITMDNLHLLSWMDYLYYADIIKATYQTHSYSDQANFTTVVSFPNALEHSSISWFTKLFQFKTYRNVLILTFSMMKDALNAATNTSLKEVSQFVKSYFFM